MSHSPPKRTMMGTQRRLKIYVGYDSPSIINYLEPSTSDLFIALFVDSHFDESVFLLLGKERNKLEKDIGWNEL